MRKITLCTLTTLITSFTVLAQSPEENVKKTIEQLFEGMRTADSTMVSQTFASGARMMTVVEENGSTRLQEGSVSRFLTAIGTPHDETWDERILDYHIQIDGKMATVWTPYRFYLGSTFSHCGVNAFQLYQSDEGWKIIQVTDTRRKEDCPD